MASGRPLAFGMIVLLSTAILASATDYTVGDSSGWTTGVDYNNWASGKSFQVDDNLIFSFVTGAHTVTEVSQSDYQACSSSNPISNSNSGPIKIALTSAGTHYFICGVPGHCSSGQKLAVTVGGSSSGSTSGSSSGSTSGPSSGSTSSTTIPTYTGTYNSASLVPVGFNAAVFTGLVMWMFGLYWF